MNSLGFFNRHSNSGEIKFNYFQELAVVIKVEKVS